MGVLHFKWEIIVVFVVGIIAAISWIIYGYRKNKFTIQPILKQNDFEPLAISPILDLKYFALMRSIFTIYVATAWIYSNINDFPDMYSFYTVWNYTFLLFYFFSVSTLSIITLLSKNGDGVPTIEILNYYRGLIWIVFQCECSLSLLVDLTVWLILVPFSSNPLQFLNYTSISMHIFNFIFLSIDLSLNSIPIHFHWGVFVIILALTYMMFSWFYYSQTSNWDYFFMDTSKPINAIWLSIVFGLHLLTWTIMYKLAQKKQRYYDRKMRKNIQIDSMSVNDNKDVGLLEANN